MNAGREPYGFSLKELNSLSTGVIKRSFGAFRQILIFILYAVAVFFVINDLSFHVESAWELAEDKLPWLVLYILAHYFCRDLGVQKGREDEDFTSVSAVYNEMCGRLRYRRREFDEYCRRLEAEYTRARRRRALEQLGIYGESEGEDVGAEAVRKNAVSARRLKRTLKRLERLEKKRPIRITYASVCSRAVAARGADTPYDAPTKPTFERYIRRRSWISVLKIAVFSVFTFSLTASLGSDPLESFICGIPYLATMISISVTAALSGYRAVLTYDVDRLSDKISVMSGFLESGESAEMQ